ncbi:ricin-type beta-trefoil lectin domain protein [Streptomyces bobili]|uniref:ricin-type beta-trefoil lectin domain protein n=1 Tax=Streptomyces bobili TaxID=67280 RepID=UPI00365DAEC8
MVRGGGNGWSGDDAEPPDADPRTGGPDARLTDLLRASPATAYPALRTLRARHHAAVLAYARLCTTSEPGARQLAAQAFTLAARETARGNDPGGPWRHQLLLLAARTAAEWARDNRAGGLDAGLLLVLNTGAPGGPVPPLLTAFRSLPSRAQGLIWYGVVEREPADRTAALLGLTPVDVAYGTAPALHSLAQAALRLRLAASDDPDCGDFRRLIEESVRPDAPRRSPDLEAHRAHCTCCATAYEEQCALRDTPRGALAEGLLPWGGTAYVRGDEADGTGRPGPRAEAAAGGGAGPSWPPSRRFVLASVALGVALAPLLILMLSSGEPSGQGSAGAVVTGPRTLPPVTVTATATVRAPSPTPTPTPSRTSPSPSPSPPRGSAPPRTDAPPPPRPTPSPVRPPGWAYAQVVNVATGRCLEVAGDFENGTDVVTVPCSGSANQRWRVDADRGVLQSSADSDYCLDSRGSVEKGLGIWQCSSVDGRNGRNLTFTVDGDGTIRPAIAIATAVTADSGGGVYFAPLDGGARQRWRAGAA